MEHGYSSSSSSSSNELELPPSALATASPSSSSSHIPTTPSPKRKAGRKKFKETRHPIYRGVRERNGGKWVCEVREPNKKSRIWLGTYPTPEMAARAHDVAAIALRGKSAALNFEDSAWLLPRAGPGNAEEIRRVAAEAAERFKPDNNSGSCRSPPKKLEHNVEEMERPRPTEVVYVDEEAEYNMPGLLTEMAEGMMLPPPAMEEGFDWDNIGGEYCHMDDISLWS